MVALQKNDVRKQVGREAFLVEPCLTLDPCTAIIVVYWEVVDLHTKQRIVTLELYYAQACKVSVSLNNTDHILADPLVLCNLYDKLKPLDSCICSHH